MSMAINARLGYWVDHNRRNIDKCQILTTDFWSQFMTGVVVVSITLITPYVFKIAKHFLLWNFRFFGWLAASWNNLDTMKSSSSSNPADPRTPLIQRQLKDNRRPEASELDDADNAALAVSEDAPSDQNVQSNHRSISQATNIADSESQVSGDTRRLEHRTKSFMDILRYSESSRETVWKLTEYGLHHIKQQCNSPSILVVVITTVLFGLFVAQVVAGIFSAKIASDRAGSVSSKQCGIWQFDDDDAGEEAADNDNLMNYQKEARASQYARTCYDPLEPNSPFSCQMFYNQSVAFSTTTHQPCPFASPKLCLEGFYSAVTFDTGLVDASVLGINAAITHKFRRTTSCSPLNSSEPYVRSVGGAADIIYQYYYGAKDKADYTFETAGRPFEWLVPVYSVNTYFSSLYPDRDYWHPIPELKPPTDSTLTIMFVSSMHIYHPTPSLDPIFHAQEPRYFKELRKPLYYNSDPRARALACVDKSEVCSPDGKICWPMTSPVPDKVPSTPAYWLMKWSLENSNIYDSIKWRLGSALLAQESIAQSLSIPLPPNQWQIEAEQLFATSLARIQFDALGIATGEDRHRPGYIDVTPDEAKGRLCGLYKFKTADYTNINLLAFIGLILLAIAILILSLNASTIGLEKSLKNDESASSQTLVVGALISLAYDLFLKGVDLFLKGIVGICTGVISLYRMVYKPTN